MRYHFPTGPDGVSPIRTAKTHMCKLSKYITAAFSMLFVCLATTMGAIAVAAPDTLPSPQIEKQKCSIEAAASALEIPHGDEIAIRATIAVPDGFAPPSGAVQFYDNGVLFASADLNDGIATLTTRDLQAGSQLIVAKFSGSAYFLPQDSTPVTVKVDDTETPVIKDIAPASVTTTGVRISLAVSGYGFKPHSVVTWNDKPLYTTFVSDNQLAAIVPSGLAGQIGTYGIRVTDEPRADLSSQVVDFYITNAKPSIAAVSPSIVTMYSSDVRFKITGMGFLPGCRAYGFDRWLETQWVSPTEIWVTAQAFDLAMPGTARLSVANPGPGPVSSIAPDITVDYIDPVIASVTPTEVASGWPSFTLTVAGRFFSRRCTLLWNGAPIVPDSVTGTTLTATIPSTLLNAPDTVAIAVQNPAPGSPVSFPVSLIVADKSDAHAPKPPGAVAGKPASSENASGVVTRPAAIAPVQARQDGSASGCPFVQRMHWNAGLIPVVMI